MQFFERLTELRRERTPFAVATVVARRAPVSSHLGDHAIVHDGGRMEGFVGGSCSREIVRREALRALHEGRPRLVQIRPEATDAGGDADCVVVPMGCASEGAVDVYIEPYLTPRRMVVVGFTPVADALARLAAALDYDVLRVVAREQIDDVEALAGARTIAVESLADQLASLSRAERDGLVAVVASQGHYDEVALEAILPARPAFAGLLASRKRAARVKSVLAQGGIDEACLAMLRNPVGLDIGARTPGDVAISILAETIAALPQRERRDDAETPHEHLDPVCGMAVDVAVAPRTSIGDEHYFFCGAHCRASFEADPAPYLTSAGR